MKRVHVESERSSTSGSFNGNCDVITDYCSGCMLPIRDRHFLSAVGRSWHSECLVCADCSCPLVRQLTCCMAPDGRFYCGEDYLRRFVRYECARCRHVITCGELVIRVDTKLVYHRDCFACILCGHKFEPGQHYALSEAGDPYCPFDFKRHFGGDKSRHLEVPLESRGVTDSGSNDAVLNWRQTLSDCGEDHTVDTVQFEMSGVAKYEQPDLVESSFDQSIDSHSTTANFPPKAPSNYNKSGTRCRLESHVMATDGCHADNDQRCQRRTRSSFDKEQLRLMTSYFSLNQNPDTNDLKQLAKRTGVEKRVLQVWFQNARAKYRRRFAGRPNSGGANVEPYSSPGDNQSSVRLLYDLLGVTVQNDVN